MPTATAHRPPPADLPEVTDAHRRAAFEAMGWAGWTFEAAMQCETRRRVIEARAHALRLRQWQATHTRTVRHVPAFNPTTGRWCMRTAPGEWAPTAPDLFTTTTLP